MHSPVFLEAPSRSQDLVTLKWMLRSAGYRVASTWHDSPPPLFDGHWKSLPIDEMKPLDTLVVLRQAEEAIPGQLGLLAGFALARGVQVIWIGEPIEPLNQLPNVRCFPSLETFRRQLAFEKEVPVESVTAEPFVV